MVASLAGYSDDDGQRTVGGNLLGNGFDFSLPQLNWIRFPHPQLKYFDDAMTVEGC